MSGTAPSSADASLHLPQPGGAALFGAQEPVAQPGSSSAGAAPAGAIGAALSPTTTLSGAPAQPRSAPPTQHQLEAPHAWGSLVAPASAGPATADLLAAQLQGIVLQQNPQQHDATSSAPGAATFQPQLFGAAVPSGATLGSAPGIATAQQPPQFVAVGDPQNVQQHSLYQLLRTVAGGPAPPGAPPPQLPPPPQQQQPPLQLGSAAAANSYPLLYSAESAATTAATSLADLGAPPGAPPSFPYLGSNASLGPSDSQQRLVVLGYARPESTAHSETSSTALTAVLSSALASTGGHTPGSHLLPPGASPNPMQPYHHPMLGPHATSIPLQQATAQQLAGPRRSFHQPPPPPPPPPQLMQQHPQQQGLYAAAGVGAPPGVRGHHQLLLPMQTFGAADPVAPMHLMAVPPYGLQGPPLGQGHGVGGGGVPRTSTALPGGGGGGGGRAAMMGAPMSAPAVTAGFMLQPDPRGGPGGMLAGGGQLPQQAGRPGQRSHRARVSVPGAPVCSGLLRRRRRACLERPVVGRAGQGEAGARVTALWVVQLPAPGLRVGAQGACGSSAALSAAAAAVAATKAARIGLPVEGVAPPLRQWSEARAAVALAVVAVVVVGAGRAHRQHGAPRRPARVQRRPAGRDGGGPAASGAVAAAARAHRGRRGEGVARGAARVHGGVVRA